MSVRRALIANLCDRCLPLPTEIIDGWLVRWLDTHAIIKLKGQSHNKSQMKCIDEELRVVCVRKYGYSYPY